MPANNSRDRRKKRQEEAAIRQDIRDMRTPWEQIKLIHSRGCDGCKEEYRLSEIFVGVIMGVKTNTR